MSPRLPGRLLAFATVVAAALSGPAAKALTPEETRYFESNIRPLLDRRCYDCHSARAEKVKGGLRLDQRDALLKGGNSGPAIVPGDPDKSLLIQAVRYTNDDLQMPPKGGQLSSREIAALEKWVRMGAPDPREDKPGSVHSTADAKDHWAWQPLQKVSVPAVKNAAWCRNPVDNFVLAKLEANGLTPNGPADKRTLIRRAYFDLIGLPPPPEQVSAFLADTSANAFEKVVDQLLASPHYGERWARHWLDVARYSDTKGEVRRFREDSENPHAYLYRDYVIKSFNDDKPYNEFIVEQLAADQLPATQTNRSLLVALDFLTVGDHYMGMRNDMINDQIDVVTKGFLGLTVSCARCHDHKFDPIPQADYYSLHGIFASSVEPEVLPVIEDVTKLPGYLEYNKEFRELAEERDRINSELVQLRRGGSPDRTQQRTLQRDQVRTLKAMTTLEMTHPGAPQRAIALQDIPRPRNSNLLIRGEAGNRGPVVPRQFLEVLSFDVRKPFKQGSGRMELAQAIADPRNPMTPRVIVNRVWSKHFGVGIVPTPDDLGTMSEPPSHPELLDYLAAKFMNEGWSIKKLHRTILLSATWQQSSLNAPEKASVDPFNRLLWRQNIQRLELEPIRDSLLAISRSLQTALYGKPFDSVTAPGTPRRTIYARIDRQQVPETFVNFDFPSPDMCSGTRHVTTVPQQALFFMNNPLVIELAKKLVSRTDFQARSDDAARIRLLYELLYQREPEPGEIELGMAFIHETPAVAVVPQPGAALPGEPSQQRRGARGNATPARGRNARGAPKPPLTAWQEYAHALVQANEFIYVR